VVDLDLTLSHCQHLSQTHTAIAIAVTAAVVVAAAAVIADQIMGGN